MAIDEEGQGRTLSPLNKDTRLWTYKNARVITAFFSFFVLSENSKPSFYRCSRTKRQRCSSFFLVPSSPIVLRQRDSIASPTLLFLVIFIYYIQTKGQQSYSRPQAPQMLHTFHPASTGPCIYPEDERTFQPIPIFVYKGPPFLEMTPDTDQTTTRSSSKNNNTGNAHRPLYS
jgi:hypothetical protein